VAAEGGGLGQPGCVVVNVPTACPGAPGEGAPGRLRPAFGAVELHVVHLGRGAKHDPPSPPRARGVVLGPNPGARGQGAWR
jgi:hypothetical protein